MLKKVCNYMIKNDLVFNNYIYDSCISSCCYDYERKINFDILNNTDKTYNAILSMIGLKNDLDENSLKQKYPGCYNCEYRNLENKQKNKKISFINLSMYPSPCQCNCIYCDIRKNKKFMSVSPKDFELYKIIFSVLDRLQNNGYIDSDSYWQVACGEITIHPFKNLVYEYTKDKKVTYFTNCFLLDKDLLEILKLNKNAKINFSIDSGNDVTWRKVKGVNNFQTVLNNLSAYIKNSSPNQVDLKYILLSEINDNKQNFVDVIRIMKEMKINKIILEKNYDVEITEKLISAKNYFITLLKDNNINFDAAF